MPERTGQQLGNYRLIRLLGQGAFAEVYLGEHIHLGTEAAIKILSSRLTSEELEQFRNEARTIARLRHPHIVRVLDFGVDESIPFLVMDYVPNGTLRQRYPKGTCLSTTQVLPHVQQIAAALQHAHDQKLIHRDIKPENMLLEANNDILLSDFGIVAIAHSSRSLNVQDISGTVAYMSPEQLQGKPRLASDQYALAIVVYEWLCGTRPFEGIYMEIAMQHALTPPTPLREKVPTIPPAVEQVVLTALAKDPHQRFATVQAFATALEQASNGSLDATMPASQSPRSPAAITLLSQSVIPTEFITPPNLPTPSSYRPPHPVVEAANAAISSSGAMFGYDLQRTRFNPDEHILSPTNVSRLMPYWTASTGDYINSSPAVANGVVYVGSTDKKLYAFAAATGQTLWAASTKSAINSSPAVANGVVYVGSTDKKLYAFAVTTGQILWTASTGDYINSSPTVANGVVYVGSRDKKLYAFSVTTGQTLRTASTRSGGSIFSSSYYWVSSSPAVANGVVYVGSDDKKLYAFSAATGQTLWTASTGNISSSPAVANGVVYVGSWDTKLYAFSATTGQTLWIASTGNRVSSSPAVADEVVYVGSDDKKLYAFSAATGQTLWTASTGGSIHSSPTVANGVVYVGSTDKKLYAFSAATGQTLWTASTGDYINSSPTVANGVVYVGSTDHKLYAFHLAGE